MRLIAKTLIIFGIILIANCHAIAATYVRVAIIQDTGSLRLAINGFYKIIDSQTQKVLERGKSISTTVICDKNGILLSGKYFASQKLLICADDPESIAINGRKFRGNIQFIKKENLHLLVINDIELEDYIKGILYHEISHYWPQEVIKAQAIVCRSYAVYQAKQNSAKDYDLTADIYSQVYGGKTSERYRTNKAIGETKGLVLIYQRKVFPAYFHATCAGHTEDASLLWNIALAPLKGVVCNFCKDSPHYNWHYVIALKEVEAALTKADKPCGTIKSISILGKDNSGRITDLKIETTKNSIIIPAKDFRIILGPNNIRSTNFNLSVEGYDAVFEGVGWGHGGGVVDGEGGGKGASLLALR